MILTVTLNPALDLTYTVDALVPHTTHRVREVAEHPGGKGLNVARVLHQAGEPVLATGLLGGATGARVADLLGVPATFAAVAGETRRTVAVVDGADATVLAEPGPVVTAAEWTAAVAHIGVLLRGAAVVVLCGSLPRGVPADAYAILIRLAAGHGVPAVLDTSGDPLRQGIAAAPRVVKPNADELATVASTVDDMLAAGVGAVAVSHGAQGLQLHTGAGRWAARPPEVIAGNPTGAGDACAAAIARGLRDGRTWPEILADAVALSAATVAEPVAGSYHVETYHRLLPRVAVATLGAPHVPPHR